MPVTGKLSAEEVIGELIRQHYDVGAVDTPVPLEGAHQRRHRKLIVNTSKGKFIVKTYACDPDTLETLRFQHRLSDHLVRNGVPVARVARTKTDDTVVEQGTWSMEMQYFVEGSGMNLNSETLITSADALGRFHTVCHDFPHPLRDARTWRFSDVPKKPFEGLLDKARYFGDKSRATQYCDEIGRFLQKAGDALDISMRDRFETGIIHGDWHAGNLLYQGNRLVGIIDLEFAGDGCYLEDLAYGISNLCIRTTKNADRLAMRTRLLLSHYQKYRTLTYFELFGLYYAAGIKHVGTVAYQITQFGDQLGGKIAGLDSVEWMNRLAFQCAWLDAQARKVREGD